MEAAVSPLPGDIEALKALLASVTQRANVAEAKLANAHARESATEAVIAYLKLQIAKPRREQYGASAERTRRLLDQIERRSIISRPVRILRRDPYRPR